MRVVFVSSSFILVNVFPPQLANVTNSYPVLYKCAFLSIRFTVSNTSYLQRTLHCVDAFFLFYIFVVFRHLSVVSWSGSSAVLVRLSGGCVLAFGCLSLAV